MSAGFKPALTSNLRVLRITVSQNLRGERKFSDIRNISESDHSLAKAQRRQVQRRFFFFKTFAPSRLCGRYSEIWLRLRRAGIFVVSEFEVISTLTYTAGFKTASGGGK
jgi:hypothetical protein